tara:strand:- start:439 stop:705 length:267 start_codon:yes stop_codon:yes gene_type:complete
MIFLLESIDRLSSRILMDHDGGGLLKPQRVVAFQRCTAFDGLYFLVLRVFIMVLAFSMLSTFASIASSIPIVSCLHLVFAEILLVGVT